MSTEFFDEGLACDVNLPSHPNLLPRILGARDLGEIRRLLIQAGFVVTDGGPSTFPGFSNRFFQLSEELSDRGEIGDYCVLVNGLFVERFERP